MRKTEQRDLIIFAACFIIFLISLMSVYVEVKQHETNMVSAYCSEQQTLDEQAASEAALILDGSGSRSEKEQKVVSKVIEGGVITQGRYFVFSGPEGIIYICNSSETSRFKGAKTADVYRHYRISSGNMTELFSALSGKVTRTVPFTFAADGTEQYISLRFFSSGGSEYLLALCSNRNYILTQNQATAHELSLYLFCGLLSVLFFGISVMFVLHLMSSRKSRNGLRKDLRERNMLIQYLTASEGQGVYRDVQTGVYNHDFFRQLLAGSRQKRLFPVQIVVIQIKSADKFSSDDIIKKVSATLMGFSSSDRITSRIGEKEFAVLMLNTSGRRARKAIRQLAAELAIQRIYIYCGITELKRMDQEPDALFDRAHLIMSIKLRTEHND